MIGTAAVLGGTERALKIPGWMSRFELAWLAQQARQHNCIVELGSYLGRSTRALGDNTTGVVWALDDWYGPRQEGDSKPDDRSEGRSTGEKWTDEERAALYDQFSHNLSDLIDTNKVIPVRVNLEEPYSIAPHKADMLFIDGDHSYQAVYRDLTNWVPQVQPDGLICGHDGNQPNVLRAVRKYYNEFYQNVIVRLIGNTTIWYVHKIF